MGGAAAYVIFAQGGDWITNSSVRIPPPLSSAV